MKTRDGYTKWSNGYITLFFLECNKHSFRLGVEMCDLEILIESACLELDSEGQCVKSNWTHVRSEHDLLNHLRRDSGNN